jgi:hypothetical protein
MNRQSPPSAWPGGIGRRLAQNSRKTTKLFVRRRHKHKSTQDLALAPNQRRLNWDTVCGSPPCSPYSELRLVLPSKTPAKREGVYTFAFAATAKRKLA